MDEDKSYNEYHQPEMQSVALENVSQKNELQVNTLPGQEALLSVRGYLPNNMQEYLSSDIKRLNEQHNISVIELKNNGNLSLDIAKKSERLMVARRVNVDNLTVEQAIQVYNFVMETTDEAQYEKGAQLYGMLSGEIGQNEVSASESYSRIGQRHLDESPDYGAYDGANNFDRADYRRKKIILANLRERYLERKYRFEDDSEARNSSQSDKYKNQDEFSRQIGKITAQHLANIENNRTVSEDDTDLMFGKDLEYAIRNRDEEDGQYTELDDDLAYGMFTDKDMALAEEMIDLRRDISNPTLNSLHLEKMRDVYTSGKVSDLIDQLDADYVEKIIGENRLTAKSAVALGVCTLDHVVAMKEKINFNAARIHNLARKVEMLCRQLLNISENANYGKGTKENEGDRYKDIKEKIATRHMGTWSQVNRGVNNLSKIDDLLQYSQELVILLEIQSNESEALLDDGNNRQPTQ